VAIGVRIEAALRALQRRFPRVGDVRGLGAMMGAEFTDDAEAGQPTIAKRIVTEARARGLLLMAAGAKGDIIRVLVPLVISDDDLTAALSLLTASCEAVLG
jgi:4-aminobutyrate aminotransferase-like enzyme